MNNLSDVKDTLKQFIDARMQEAIRAQASCPDSVYAGSGLIRNVSISSGKFHNCSGSSSCDHGFRNDIVPGHYSGYTSMKKDFKW